MSYKSDGGEEKRVFCCRSEPEKKSAALKKRPCDDKSPRETHRAGGRDNNPQWFGGESALRGVSCRGSAPTKKKMIWPFTQSDGGSDVLQRSGSTDRRGAVVDTPFEMVRGENKKLMRATAGATRGSEPGVKAVKRGERYVCGTKGREMTTAL